MKGLPTKIPQRKASPKNQQHIITTRPVPLHYSPQISPEGTADGERRMTDKFGNYDKGKHEPFVSSTTIPIMSQLSKTQLISGIDTADK